MHMIVAFSVQETPTQYTKCEKWNYKKENYTKQAQYYYYNSDKYIFETHQYEENNYVKEASNCLYLPKCIVCNGLYNVSYKEFLLKPR